MSDAKRAHTFECRLAWRGCWQPAAVDRYEGYSRDYVVEFEGKPPLLGSAAPAFRGSAALHNPEDWLVAALSACHCLSYLALCARADIRVSAYEDFATGAMASDRGRMAFRSVSLTPRVRVACEGASEHAWEELSRRATALHVRAHDECFIANSVNFAVTVTPSVTIDR